MMSRLNQLNDTRLTLPLLYRGAPVVVGVTGTSCVTVTFAVGDRIPPSVMPWSALEQANQGKPAAPKESVLTQSFDGVLTARRAEPAGRQAQRRDRVAVELDHVHRSAHRPRPGTHDGVPLRRRMRSNPAR